MIPPPRQDVRHPADQEAAPMSDTPRTLLLTGASRGIGHATVKLFQENGWRVLTVSRHAFSEECRWPGARWGHIQADLADLDALPRLVDEVRERIAGGPLHALVNNAGISPKGPGGTRLGVAQTDARAWTHVLNVNLISTALLARALLPELEAARGAIVNVTSIAGSRVHPFAGVAYAASKAGLASLTREFAHEFGPRGVRANAIAPGEIRTAILSPGTDDLVRDNVPLGRLGEAREVAETIHFLCSEASAYINGAEIHINGGQHV
jgi:NAD(P)-dependent dehydrogenase (short-subunit alcohol dehydrogenase family)